MRHSTGEDQEQVCGRRDVRQHRKLLPVLYEVVLQCLIRIERLGLKRGRPLKKKFVSPTTFWRVEMCHQDSVIRDIKLGQKRA